MLAAIQKYFAPAPHRELRSDAEVQRLYPRYRLTILSTTFAGYAMFYLVRNNLATVAKDIGTALHYDKSMLGDILAVSALMYGVGKFVMGSFSDRSDPRKFMAFGLVLTALCNFAFGSVQSFPLHLGLWALNGFIQGMGWGPCGRSLGHWFSVRERGTVFAIWNIAHNVGGGLAGIVAAYSAHAWGWPSAFYVPGIIALVGAAQVFFSLVDTPQSVGLPAVEVYRKDMPAHATSPEQLERELTLKEILLDHVVTNKMLWVFALANFFVYISRYAMLDWGPTYLREVKGASLSDGGFAVTAIEFAGIPSTILIGWFSDKVGGRRGMVSCLCMIPIILAFAGILLNPIGNLWLDFTLLGVIGFFVYPPVMLLGVAALDLSSKKAVGAAAGFVGLFGYLGRTAQAKGFGWMAEYYGDKYGTLVGWDYVLYAILGCTVMGTLLLLFTWNTRPKA